MMYQQNELAFLKRITFNSSIIKNQLIYNSENNFESKYWNVTQIKSTIIKIFN